MPSRVLAVLACTAAVLASCGDGEEATPPSRDRSGGSGATSSGAEPADQPPGDGLLAFEAQAIDGSTIDVGSYAGEDLAIWFWAPW